MGEVKNALILFLIAIVFLITRFFFKFFWPHILWDLSPLIRDQTYALGSESPNHWTVKKFPRMLLFILD